MSTRFDRMYERDRQTDTSRLAHIEQNSVHGCEEDRDGPRVGGPLSGRERPSAVSDGNVCGLRGVSCRRTQSIRSPINAAVATAVVQRAPS